MFKKFFKNIIHKKQQERGFTLLETLVAVFILTLALTGPIYIASLAIRSSVESRDNVSAYYLAEEALEVIRNKRDQISFTNTGDANQWLSDIVGGADCLNAATAASISTCYMTRDETGAYGFGSCTGGVCPPLAFNPTGNIIYGDSSVTSNTSKFSREIYLQTGSQDPATNNQPVREVKVVVSIKWVDRGRDRVYTLVEHLYNQQYAKYYEN